MVHVFDRFDSTNVFQTLVTNACIICDGCDNLECSVLNLLTVVTVTVERLLSTPVAYSEISTPGYVFPV